MKRLNTIATCCALAAGSWHGTAAMSPLSPEHERTTFQLADPNLTIELVASEPAVRAPVALAWDADGRMFVAEMTDYPSGPVNGRVRLLEDRDGDGRYEHATIFATNLAFPNGVMAWRHGLLVTAAPDIWFLADTNGDGVADVREKILTGFAEGNQQLRVNGLFWGIDNWIYGANGRSDGEAKWTDGTPAGSIRRHDFRFRPDTKQFEPVAGNSQFGMGHDDWGNRFPVFNATPIRHVAIEDRYLARQPLLAGTDNVPSISPPTDGNRVFPITSPNVLIPQPVGFFTSACGPSIFRGHALPQSYRGNYFVCEPVQNIVQRRVPKPNGSTFVAEYADAPGDFLASSDPWFHGVFTATGPDGALYIVDFYRDLVEHPHWVAPELRDKVDWRKGEEHGRIWRVRAKDAKRAPLANLSRAANAELVKALESDNGWTRDAAQRLLVERNARDVVPALEGVAQKGATPQSRVCALGLLARLNARSGEANVAALPDEHAAVRMHAIRLLENDAAQTIKSALATPVLKTLAAMTADPDPQVRLQLACSLGTFVDDDQKLNALARIAGHESLDQWQSLAIISSAGARPWMLIHRLTEDHPTPNDAQLALLEQAARIIAAGTNAEDKQAVIAWLANWKSPQRVIVAAAFADGFRSRRDMRAADPKGDLLPIVFAAAEAAARNSAAPVRVRVAAIHLSEPGVGVPLVSPKEPEAVQTAAGRAIMESGDRAAIQQVLERLSNLPTTVRRQIIAAAVRSRNGALELERAASEQKVALIEIDPTTRQALEKFADAEVKSRAVELFKGAVSPDREAQVQKFRAALALPGDRQRGAAAFEKNCTVCHQMQGVGAKVGPDLSGIGQQPRETLLVQILDPSRQVLPDFVAYAAETRSGDTFTGFIAAESATTVTLRRANEPDVTLPRAGLKELSTSGKSLMPDGLEAGMTEQDMADLIEFLRRPDRTLFSQSK